MMDEIFGAENFIANISWEKRYTRRIMLGCFILLKILSYSIEKALLLMIFESHAQIKSYSIYKNPDKDPRGVWTSSSHVNSATKAQRPNLVYPIKNPFTGQIIEHPTHAWKYEFTEHQRHIDEKRLWWGKNEDAKFPRLKSFSIRVNMVD
jgi:adenine-specific DNA-methyltransferase